MQVFYDPWQFDPNTGYYFKTCHYQFNPTEPWYYFYIIFYRNDPYYRNYFYCYWPWGGGFYWCRCYSPLSPAFDNSLFAVLPDQFRFHTVQACEPHFPAFTTMPAHFPPNFTTPMNPLPSDLP